MDEIERRIARGRIFSREKSAPATLEIEYSDRGVDPVYCTVIVDDNANTEGIVQQDQNDLPFVQVAGSKFGGDDIWIPVLKLYGGRESRRVGVHSGTVFQGFANLFVEMFVPASSMQQGEYDCYLTVPETGSVNHGFPNLGLVIEYLVIFGHDEVASIIKRLTPIEPPSCL